MASQTLPVLYVSYSGLLEPLGQSQVLPYVRGLALGGQPMIVLSFEKPTASHQERTSLKRSLEHLGIRWVALRYHRWPRVASTIYDIAMGIFCALWLGRHGLRLIHARAHVPAAIALVAATLLRRPFLFDHRGLMAEEFADAGIWLRAGILYRWTTRIEQLFLRQAKAVVVLTDRFAREIQVAASVDVIPCAVDLERYQPFRSSEPEYDLVYAGSWTGLYLADETLRFFRAFKAIRPLARFLILTTHATSLPRGTGVECRSAAPSEVPHFLSSAKAGISLRRPGRAQLAASPVKISEYWACGLPVVTSPGVGDLDALIQKHQSGVVLTGLSEDDLSKGARALVRLIDEGDSAGHRCRRLAEERYDVRRAIVRYKSVYERAAR